MGQYKSPRSLNLVSFLLLIALAAAGYGAFRFVPVLVQKVRVGLLLSDAVNRYWKERNKPARIRGDFERTMRENVMRQMRDLGVDDEDLDVQFSTDGQVLTVEADYTVVIEHPWIHKYTSMHFHPRAETSTDSPW